MAGGRHTPGQVGVSWWDTHRFRLRQLVLSLLGARLSLVNPSVILRKKPLVVLLKSLRADLQMCEFLHRHHHA